jgi:hypothetical protein
VRGVLFSFFSAERRGERLFLFVFAGRREASSWAQGKRELNEDESDACREGCVFLAERLFSARESCVLPRFLFWECHFLFWPFPEPVFTLASRQCLRRGFLDAALIRFSLAHSLSYPPLVPSLTYLANPGSAASGHPSRSCSRGASQGSCGGGEEWRRHRLRPKLCAAWSCGGSCACVHAVSSAAAACAIERAMKWM